MRSLSDLDLLAAWESGLSQDPLDRALTLLLPASPGRTLPELAGLSIGERDRRLLDLREQWFGQALDGFAECPACGEAVEFQFRVTDVRVAEAAPPPGPLELKAQEWTLQFRLPTSADLGEATRAADPASAFDQLTRRCVLGAERAGIAAPMEDMPAAVLEALSQRMAEHDPQSAIYLDLNCPACAHRWQALFDIASFLWTEVGVRARRLLQEVDLLARAYGWSEAEILALNPARRRAYLELASA